MSFLLSNSILKEKINHHPVDYSWDDTDVYKNLTYDFSECIVKKITPVSLRAKLTLMIGVYEWIYFRLNIHLEKAIFLQVIDATYCANINKNYLIDIHDFDNLPFARPDFIGPVNGVIWCAAIPSLLMDFYVSDNSINIEDMSDSSESDDFFYDENTYYDKEIWKPDLTFLIALTLHILPQEQTMLFKTWLQSATDRLIQYYTIAKEDPFANLFGHKDDKEWLGDYVAREVLDLDYSYDPKNAVKLCDQFLQQVDYHNNPFLRTPEELQGKIKQPYRLID